MYESFEKGIAKFYCHKCNGQVENVRYSQDDSVKPPAQIQLCNRCFHEKLFSRSKKRETNKF